MTPKKLISALKRLGFYIDRQRGSHAVLVHADGRITVVPMHGKDLPPGTLHGILADIDVPVDALIESL